jgi:iron(III) transport system ATP-binding protein
MSVAVTIRDVTVRFGDTAAVTGATLAIEPGELMVMIGASGSGKTTLLRSIAGFVEASAGSIRFDDEDVTRLPPHRRNVGMVFQSLALWPHMSVAENVAFGLRERRVPRAEIAGRVAEALEATQMKGYQARRIDELSGGEQQRVALARALVVHPRCLLLDEPLSSLDAKLRQSMREEVRRICKSFGLTTLYVTHDQKEALAVADRLAVMKGGRILQVGTPADLYRRPASRDVAAFVGDSNLIKGRVAAADAAGTRVESVLGALLAAPDGGFAPGPGTEVWISIRPECLRPTAAADGPNVLRGQRTGSVYLGEIADHRLQVGDVTLSMYELNPAQASGAPAPLTVHVAPADVVLLPLE